MKKLPAWEKYWGWVVVFARFITLFMLVGTYKTFGVLMDSYIEDLDANSRQAGWATSMFFTVVYFTGKLLFNNKKSWWSIKKNTNISVLLYIPGPTILEKSVGTLWIHIVSLSPPLPRTMLNDTSVFCRLPGVSNID